MRPEPLEAIDHASPISGKTVVFTGTLEKHDALGGQGAGRAPRRQGGGLGLEETDYVVAGPGAGSKLKDAERLGSKC